MLLISPQDGQIIDAVKEALLAEDMAKGAVQNLISTKVKAGQLLREKKLELPHGEWLPWIEANLEIDDATVARWIRLSKFAETKGADIEDAKSVTEAYRLAGILPEPEPSKSNFTQTIACLGFLQKIELRFEQTLGQIAPDEIDQLRTRLRRLLDRLDETSLTIEASPPQGIF